MNEHLQAVQDAAWNLKDLCDDLAPRKLGERDQAALASVRRDLGRLEAKLIAIRDKRKRGTEPETIAADRETNGRDSGTPELFGGDHAGE